jgi:histidinol dehydrogenase
MSLLRVLSAGDEQAELLLRRASVLPREAEEQARLIVDDVRRRGDAAVAEHTRRLEGREAASFEVDRARWDAAADGVDAEVARALERAAARIRAFHERQRESGYAVEEEGVRLALRVDPLARVGLYVPGGTARYPSSVLMTAVPARVAGVGELVMATPGASPETLCAARLAGVDRVFELGGAQAVAALAYGTETVPRVDKIVGPGSMWVAAAKKIVFGDVDIDQVAGPSEVLIVADAGADARLIAADLLAQAEHDPDAQPLLVTPSLELARRVAGEVERQVATLPRRAVCEEALRRHGAALVTDDLPAALRLANRFAPEHVELHVANPARHADQIRAAGAIFVGPFAPEAAGDYLAGPNHVLPTGGSARYGSPLGVWDFVKRTTILEYTRDGLRGQADDVARLARVEGLEAHARSIAARFEGDDR